MNRIRKLARSLKHLLIRGGIALIRALPYPLALVLGRFFGLLGWLVDPFHRRVAQIQMRHCLGDAYHPSLVRRVFMNHGDILVDTIKYAYMDDSAIRERIAIEGREHLDDALARGKGLMLITGHIGNWEILAHLPRLLGIRFCVMADVRNDPGIEAVVDGIRSRSGATILPPKGKALMLIRELKKGNIIGMVMDQRGKRSDGLFCELFGLPAPTNPAPAFIALKGDTVILPVTAIKERGRYRIRFYPPREASSFGGREAMAPLSRFMQSWVESVVREHPVQWFWLHCRWTRRSEMRMLIRTGGDFRSFVLAQAPSGPAPRASGLT
ncbi:MAG: lysophospholipid acyltransferase family protein [Desulfomonilia bacterium]|jgi:KDO2-lipid IV(A) lauroyltransferase